MTTDRCEDHLRHSRLAELEMTSALANSFSLYFSSSLCLSLNLLGWACIEISGLLVGDPLASMAQVVVAGYHLPASGPEPTRQGWHSQSLLLS